MAKKNTIKVNWDEVNEGKFLRTAGEYIVKLTKAEQDEDDEGKPFIEWSVRVEEGKEKGSITSFRTYLTAAALWKFKALLEAIQYEITEGIQEIDLDNLIKNASPFVVDAIEGKERADGKGHYIQIDDYMALEKEEAPKEEKAPKSKKGKKSLDELEALIDKHELDIDLEDYDSYEEAEAAVKKAIKDSSDDEEEPTEVYTDEDLDDMGSKELKALAKKIGLELDDDESTRSKRKSVKEALKKLKMYSE